MVNNNLFIFLCAKITIYLAKIASDYNKPNATTVVTNSGLEEFFFDLKLSKIPGIGKKSARRMLELGYTTCGQLFNMNLIEMQLAVGGVADFLFCLLRPIRSGCWIVAGF